MTAGQGIITNIFFLKICILSFTISLRGAYYMGPRTNVVISIDRIVSIFIKILIIIFIKISTIPTRMSVGANPIIFILLI